GSVDQRLKACVAERAAVVVEGGAPASTFRHVPVHEEGGDVEAVGDLERCHPHQRRFPPRRARARVRVLPASRGLAAGAAAFPAFRTAIASISTSSSGRTSRDTTRRVLGGDTPSGK